MNPDLSLLDWTMLGIYFLATLVIGCMVCRRASSLEQLTLGSRTLSSWACGASIYATYLSSMTFLALPGQAFATTWNPFAFSLALPLAGWIATRYFLSYYRDSGIVSAYSMLETRFGLWARLYASSLYLLLHLARSGMVLYLMALAMAALFGWPLHWIIIGTGLCVTAYSWLGGFLAVIWTDFLQAIVLTFGALCALIFLFYQIPGGIETVIQVGWEKGKFSLGNLSITDLTQKTFWVVLIYGLVENLRNFGVDQSFIQRYVAARTTKEGGRSIWICVWVYLAVSFVFVWIGTSLFVFYSMHEEELPAVHAIRYQQQSLQTGVDAAIIAQSQDLPTSQMDAVDLQTMENQIFAHFIAVHLPSGVKGLLLAALFAATMSTISTSIHSSATLVVTDFYQRLSSRDLSQKQLVWVLRTATTTWGILGVCTGLYLMQFNQGALGVWWALCSIICSGLIGLLLMGMLFSRLTSTQAFSLILMETLLAVWLTCAQSGTLPAMLMGWSVTIHPVLNVVLGTIFLLVGGFCFEVFNRAQERRLRGHTALLTQAPSTGDVRGSPEIS